MECVSLAVPSLKELKPTDIQELRERILDDVKPFRRAVLRLAKSVNDAITADGSVDDVVRAAQFVVGLTRFCGHRSRGGYGVDHGRSEDDEAAATELHRRVQGELGSAGAGRGEDDFAGRA